MITKFEDECLLIQIDPQLSLIFSTWKHPPVPGEVKAGFMKILELIEIYSLKYWLSDIRERMYIPEPDQTWLIDMYFPLLMRSPLVAIARIVTLHIIALQDSYDLLDRLSTNQEFKIKLRMEIFIDDKSARDWLLGFGSEPKKN